MNIQQLMKQAQAMQKKIEEAQAKLGDMEFEGASGGGLVKVTVNGKGEMINVALDPSVIDPEDGEVLEDLIVAAFNDAKKKADEEASGSMADAAGGMGLPPGFKMPF